MIIRNARLGDAKSIAELINGYAEKGLMLKRSVESVVEGVRSFIVAEDEGKIVGCCAVAFFTTDLAEVRSIAVHESYQKKGVGSLLLDEAERQLKEEGVRRVFVLTRSEPFFTKSGYSQTSKSDFPHKIWRDCVNCPLLMECDEIAMEKILS
jgi:amino-acid N-acetyltransferase